MKKLGMRNLKTSLAVVLCNIIFWLWQGHYSFYGSIAAVISMQDSVTSSFHTGKNRMIGTFIGAFVGFILSLIDRNNIILIAVGIIIIIYLCNLLNYKKPVTIACIVFLAIMINTANKSPLNYSVNRLIETLLGITVAVLVNYFLAPPDLMEDIKRYYKKLMNKIFCILEDELFSHEEINLEELEKELEDLKSIFKSYLDEMEIRRKEKSDIKGIEKTIKILDDLFVHLNIIKDMGWKHCITMDNYNKLEKLYNKYPKNMKNNISSEEKLSNNDIVFNYHLDKVLNKLSFLLIESDV